MRARETSTLPGDRVGAASVALPRWALLITIAYAVIFSSVTAAPLWPHQIFVAAILLSNLLLTWVLAQGKSWKRLSGWAIVLDIAAVSLAIIIAGDASADFYVVFFAVLILAAVIDRFLLLVPLALVACASYALLLYTRIGIEMFQSPADLVRVVVLLVVALYFGNAAQRARREYASWKRDRTLQALSEMGSLVFTGSFPGPVLHEVTRRVQEVVGVERCSLVVFDRGGAYGYLAASGDDPGVEVLLLQTDQYPEMRPILESGEIVEVHPGEPAELWEKVQRNLPETSPFRSFLLVPIRRDDKVLGVFFLRDPHPERIFSEADKDFCSQAAQMVSAFIHEHDLVEQLRQRSRHDGLTGLLNFQTFREEASELARPVAAGNQPLSLVVVDIDQMGEVNRSFGYTAGNELICAVGHCLAEALPGAPAVCRYGGDEFAALVHASTEDSAELLQRSFLDRLEETRGQLPEGPRASIGIASLPLDGDDADALHEAAQRAMRLARSGGGHRICISEAGSPS
ncbi:MAG: diguanylate cyclase domain-containing protein [Acidobacteriota bacterium]